MKHFTKEHRRKLSEAHKGKATWNKGLKGVQVGWNKGNRASIETRIKSSKSHTGKFGEKVSNWRGGPAKRICEVCNKEFYVKQSEVKKGWGRFCSARCRGIWVKSHTPNKGTSIELAIEKELINFNIPYIKQCPIEGIALVDFLLPNKIIVQCDGDYWHSLPKQIKRDMNQDFILGFKGYKIFRFKESEIKKSTKNCVLKIIKNRRYLWI